MILNYRSTSANVCARLVQESVVNFNGVNCCNLKCFVSGLKLFHFTAGS